jgi:predicted alpha/beta-fold hydrolase
LPDVPFRERFPWIGGDLQTVRNYLVPPSRILGRWPGERVEFDAGDGTGDRLLAALHRPDPANARRDAPLVVLVHGLTGCEGSFYVLETARFLLAHGISVLRLNLRGAGPSRGTCGGHYSAASSGDIARVVEVVGGAVALVGYSLGGSIVLRYLADDGVPARVRAAIVVSTPIDLAATARRLLRPRNAIYHRWLLARMKEEALSGAARLAPGESEAVMGARDVVGFDDAFVAPRNGFADAADYYARCSAAFRLDGIRVPTLLIHGRNDPWIPSEAYDALALPASGAIRLALAAGGGHVGFHGADRETPWHNRLILRHVTGAA